MCEKLITKPVSLDIYAATRSALDGHPHAKAVAVTARRWGRKLGDPLNGYADRKTLIRRYPGLENRNRFVEEFPRELTELYQEYVSSVSNRVMAISLELSQFMLSLCRQIEPKSILDLGSGYSSVVFRYYAKNCTTPTTVVTVDDSPAWLERTRVYLTTHNLPDENMMDWASFIRPSASHFDLVFYDLGHVRELRTELFEQILKYVRPGGVVILDDMNFLGYKRHVKRTLKGMPFEPYSAESFSKDSLGRYPYILVAEEPRP